MAIMSYAQNFEDVLLKRLFPEHFSGFYIDVGACHPIVHSVTKLFYERGWHGINIEPIPSFSELLAHDRPRDTNLPIGLSNGEGTSTFYECLTKAGSSTFSEAQAEVLRRTGYKLVEHSIPVRTLAQVCEQYAGGRTIDFLKIDVENHEQEVLEGADWSRYRPRVILVEATRPETNIPNHENWEPLLLAAGYLFAFFDGLNRYYVRVEDRQLLPLLGVPANVFDDFELHVYHERIAELRHAFEASQESRRGTQTALDVARAALDETRNALVAMRQAWEDSQVALHGLRVELEASKAQLDVTQAQLDVTQAQLDVTQAQLGVTQAELGATQGQLAPFQELGPIAIGVARRLRRMSSQSPRLASIAKRIIRRAHPRARVPVPNA